MGDRFLKLKTPIKDERMAFSHSHLASQGRNRHVRAKNPQCQTKNVALLLEPFSDVFNGF
jgi:hypothetical protein